MSELSDYKRCVSDPLEESLRNRICALQNQNIAPQAETTRLREQLRVAREALKLSRNRIEQLGLCCTDNRHEEDNERTYFPAIDAALEQIGE